MMVSGKQITWEPSIRCSFDLGIILTSLASLASKEALSFPALLGSTPSALISPPVLAQRIREHINSY